MALVNAITGEVLDTYALKLGKQGKRTEHDADDKLTDWLTDGPIPRAALEEVHAMPAQGVTSMFSFGRVYGFLIGLLVAHRIPFTLVTPRRWMKDLSFQGGGIKSRSRIRASREFPNLKVTNDIADAILIGRWLYLEERKLRVAASQP